MRGALRDPQIAVDGVDLLGVSSAASVLPPKYSRRARLFQKLTASTAPLRSSCRISAESGVYGRTFGRTFVITQSTTSFIWAASL